MSKANDQPSEMNTEPAPVDKPGWILLQEARLAQGMDIEPLAAILKIPARKIEALEAGALSGVGDLTFSRALAGSICRQLRIDAKPILAAWPTPLPAPPQRCHPKQPPDPVGVLSGLCSFLFWSASGCGWQ